MKTAVILLGLLVTFVDAEQKPTLNELLSKYVDICVESMRPNPEIIEALEMDDYDKYEVQCFIACVFEKANVMTDGQIDYEVVKERLRETRDIGERQAEFIISVTKPCQENAEAEDDECQVIGNYLKCIMANIDAANGAG